MDSHRNYAPDEHDGQARQPERGYSNPEWDRAGGDPRYAPVSPAPVSGGMTYGHQRPAYPEPTQAYDDFQSPRGGYPRETDSPFPPIGDAAGRGRDDGAGSAMLAMPVGPRSGQQLPPLPPRESVAPTSGPVIAPMPPGFSPAPEQSPSAGHAGQAQGAGAAPYPVPGAMHPAPGAVHSTPNSGMPYLTAEDLPQSAGRHPQAGDPHPVSGNPYPVSGNPHPVSGNPHPVSGNPYPISGGPGLGGPAEETQVVHQTEAIDRSALRRPAGGQGQAGDRVYRSRRPGTAAVLVVITVLFELMALRLLASSFLTSKVQVGGSIASFFLVLGLPMFSVGLYGLLSGVAAGPGDPARLWLRQPLVYLPVALALFLVAGLAAA